MPTERQHDITLGGRGFMLARKEQVEGRVWDRQGRAQLPGGQVTGQTERGILPPQVNHQVEWNDWSGGYGYAYWSPDHPNTLHWSENFDYRFPRQLVHCQSLQLLSARYASASVQAYRFAEVPLPGVATPPAGAAAVLVLGEGYAAHFVPTGLMTAGSAFDFSVEKEQAGLTFDGRPATYGSFTYVPNSDGSGIYMRTHAGAWAQGDIPSESFLPAGSRLWRKTDRNLLSSCAVQGTAVFSASNWSATFNIGAGDLPITDLVDLSGQVFAGMADGLYAGDASGTFYNVLSDLRGQRNSDNARDLCVHQGGILVPHSGGLWHYRPSGYSTFYAEAKDVGPVSQGAKSPVVGRIRCVTAFGGWAYAGLWTGSQSYILGGHEGTTGQYNWTVMQSLPHDTKVSRLFIDSITTPSGGGRELPARLWVATEQPTSAVGTAGIYFCPTPRMNQNPLAPDPSFSANYVGSARADFPALDFLGITMLHKSVEIWSDNLASGSRYADVYYKVDSGPRTLLGRAATSPKSTVYFPADGATFVTGKQIELSLESFTHSAHMSPVYRSIILNSTARPVSADIVTAQVRVADNLRDRRGAPMRPGASMLSELRAFARGETPQMLVDLAGASQWVAVINPVGEQEAFQSGTDAPEVLAQVTMAVLDFTANLGDIIMGSTELAGIEG